MSVTIFWDSSFKVRTLEPKFVDGVNVTSPVTLASSAQQVLQVPQDAKFILLRKDPVTGTCKVSVEVSKTALPGAPAYEPGVFFVDLDEEPTQIPLEGVTYVRVTNDDAASRNISFMFGCATP